MNPKTGAQYAPSIEVLLGIKIKMNFLMLIKSKHCVLFEGANGWIIFIHIQSKSKKLSNQIKCFHCLWFYIQSYIFNFLLFHRKLISKEGLTKIISNKKYMCMKYKSEASAGLFCYVLLCFFFTFTF